MKVLRYIAIILVILGGINWGLIALADFNLIHAIVDHIPLKHLLKIVYSLVGISAIYLLINIRKFG